MVKENPYYINTKLPETATVSYYNPETDQNLTAEEWKQLHPTVNPSEVRIINQGEVYRSWKAEVDYPAYGPMPFVNESAVMIAGSQSIMTKIRRDFPNVAELLDWNREGTLGFLKEKHALNGYLGTDAFKVPCSLTDNYSKNGSDAWKEYRKKIEEYVANICKGSVSEHYEALGGARTILVDYIHNEYYRILPKWPDVGQTNTRSFEANIGSSYNNGSSSQIVWNCTGWIEVTDKRPTNDTFMASFSGRPEIKLLILNLDRLRQIEEKCKSEGIEGARNYIRNNDNSYRQIGWDNF